MKIEMLKGCEDLKPKYMTAGSVGMDIKSAEDVILEPKEIRLIGSGFKVQLPNRYEAQIRARSSLVMNGVFVINSPGTIDTDYRGEVKILLCNLGMPYKINRGDRIAQMIINKVARPVIEYGEVNETKRGEGGFGSTGK